MTNSSSAPALASALYPRFESLGDATGFIDEILEFVQHIPLLDSFSRPDIETLARYMPCFGAPGGVELLHEGNSGDFLLVILTGETVIHKRDPLTGDAKRIAVAGPGTTLGELSLIDGELRFASCSTVAPTDFAVLSRQALDQVVQAHPALGHRLLFILLQLLAKRLRKTSNDLLPHIATSAMV